MLKNSKRDIAKAAVIAGLLGVMLPSTALGATTTRSYTWQNGQQQPTAAQTISEGGKTYTLQSTSTPVQSNGNNTVTQYFTTTQSAQVGADQAGSVQSAVPQSTGYSQDGFSGTLQRTSVNYTPVYVDQQRTENGTRNGTVTGTADSHPDDSVTPSTISQNGHQMSRTGVTWTKAGGDSQATVWTWTATYSGNYTEHVLDHYNVTGNYGGNLSKTVNNGSWSMTATYTAPDDQQQDEGQTETIPDQTDQNQDQNQDQETPDDANAEAENENVEDENEGVDDFYGDENENYDGYGMETSTPDESSNTNASVEKSPFQSFMDSIREHPLYLLIPGVIILAIIIAAILASRKKKAPVAATIPTDIYALNSELVEFVNDGTDDNQHVIATCDSVLSPDKDTPTLVEIPAPPAHFEQAIATDENGNEILDENGNQMVADYYVLLGDDSQASVATDATDENGDATLTGLLASDYVVSAIDASGLGSAKANVTVKDGTTASVTLTLDGQDVIDTDDITRDAIGQYPGDGAVSVHVVDDTGRPVDGVAIDVFPANLLNQAKSDRLVITSNDLVIYDGQLADQIKVDGDALEHALNNDPDDGQNDISEDIQKWHDTYDAYDANRASMIADYNEKREQQDGTSGYDGSSAFDDVDDTQNDLGMNLSDMQSGVPYDGSAMTSVLNDRTHQDGNSQTPDEPDDGISDTMAHSIDDMFSDMDTDDADTFDD